MKGLITDVSLYLRPLHKQSFEVDNLAGFILAGNSRLLVLVKRRSDVLFWSKFVANIYQTHLTINRFVELVSMENEEQNQLAVYKYLMSIETSEEYIITRRPKTRYYRETIQSAPPEIKWLEYFICEEFPQTFCSKNRGLYNYTPSTTQSSSSTLVSSYAVFIRGGKYRNRRMRSLGTK